MSELLEQLKVALTDRYLIDSEIGSGGMAVVYGATDFKHDRQVALKVMRPEVSASLGSDRFLREIRIVAKLTHPHILPLYDSGEAAGLLYYVMPLIEGDSLRDRLDRGGPLEIKDALQVVREAGSALSHAHAQGIVHRDIKPGNILISGGHAVVADFGIASAVTEAGGESLTRTGVSVGTPDYMSPEQAAGDQPVDARSDEYALACVLYEMLVGQPPFTGPTPMAVMARHSLDPVPSIRTLRSTIPAELEESLNRGLAKMPADRFQTVDQFVEAVTGEVSASQSKVRKAGVRATPSWLGWAVAAVALLVAAVFIARQVDFRSLSSPAPTEELVAVLDFEGLGLGELNYLTEAIPEFLSVALTGEAGGARAIDRQRVRKAWNRAQGTTTDRNAQYAAVAEDLGATLVVTGRILLQPNDGLRAHAELRRGREVLATRPVVAPASEAIAVAESLGVQLLAGSAGEFERLPGLVSSSTAAVKEWIAGRNAFRRGDWQVAMERFSAVLDRDSTFALAAWGLMLSAGWLEGEGRAWGRGRRLAWAHRDRLPPADSAIFVAESYRNAYPERISRSAKIGLYERAVQLYPDRWDAWYHYGDYLWHEGGAYVDDGRARAVDMFSRAIALDSTAHAEPWQHLGDHYRQTRQEEKFGDLPEQFQDTLSKLLFAAIDPEREIGEAEWQWFRESYQPPMIGLMELQAMGLAMEDAERMAAVLEERAAEGDGNSAQVAGNFALNRGQPERATPLLRVASESADQCGIGTCQHPEMWLLAGVYWDAETDVVARVRDSLEVATSELTAQAVARSDPGAASKFHARCWLAITDQLQQRLANVESTLALARDVVARTDSPGVALLCAATLEALRAVDSSAPDAAQRVAAADSVFGFGASSRYQAAWQLVLTDMYATVGQPEKALGILRRFWIVGGEERTHYLSARLLRRARLAADLGYREEAMQAYERYLALRSDPEPVLEEKVAGVRAELEVLRGD